VGPGSKQVQGALDRCLAQLGPELEVLGQVPLAELQRVGGAVMAEAIRRMRAGEVRIEAGFDGEFGRVHLLEPEERRELGGQTVLFAVTREGPAPPEGRRVGASAPTGPAGPLFGGPLDPLRETQGDPEDQGVLCGLSPAQRRAATHGDGRPVIIRAGPGTGKTRTLTVRIAHRVMEGGDPARIVAVTFTNKAAAELAGRLTDLLGEERARQIRVCTFHALALAVLNDQRRLAGKPPVEVVGEEARREMVAGLLPQASASQVAREAQALSQALLLGEESSLWPRYRATLESRGAVDLDSLVPESVDLLQREAELLRRWRGRCNTLCVDEYQDVNLAQFELVRLLCPRSGAEVGGADLCVIGDPDQAIYGFRGADPGYFLRFTEDHPDAVVLTLDRSYRTAGGLLRAAQQVIRQNPGREQAETWSREPGATRVSVCPAPSAAAEAELVVHNIERLLGGTTLFSLDSGLTGAGFPTSAPSGVRRR
jgi:DNA helicase-2/ATP-dependent DNA helicase PcrA